MYVGAFATPKFDSSEVLLIHVAINSNHYEHIICDIIPNEHNATSPTTTLLATCLHWLTCVMMQACCSLLNIAYNLNESFALVKANIANIQSMATQAFFMSHAFSTAQRFFC